MKVYKRNDNKSYYISFFINSFLAVAICLLLTSCEAGQKNIDANINEQKTVKENKKSGSPIGINEGEESNTEDLREEKGEIEKGEIEKGKIEEGEIENGEIEEGKIEKGRSVKGEAENIRLVMIGDILLHDAVNKCFEKEKGKYDYSPVFEHTRDELAAADIAIVNQEVIIGGEQLGVTGYPSFNAPYEIGDALADSGFDIVCHATNHALDRGKKGLVNCMNFWSKEHPEVEVLGIHDTEADSENIYVSEVNGMKIAFLNYTYGTNGINAPSDMKWSVDLLNNKEKIKRDIVQAEEMADFTVVCPHWGTEYSLIKIPEQEEWANLFVENGVDLVIGTHPHVIEPIEWLEDEKTGNRMLVYYSLGNYVNWTSGTGPGVSNRMIGGMAEVDIGFDESGRAMIKDYGVEALVCHLIKEKGKITVYPLREYNDKLADENRIKDQDPDFSLDYCRELCNKVWGEVWQ